MGSATLNIIIENIFNTAWGNTTPIKFENVPFNPPSNAAWVEVSVHDGSSSKKTLGPSVQLRRSLGTVFITVYGPLNQGSKPTRQLADQITAIFRDLQTDGITFFEGSVSKLGEVYYTHNVQSSSTPSTWYQMKVAIPYFYDQYL